MKGKEEDEERNQNICLQTDNQSRSNSKTEATLSTVVCGSSGNAGQYFPLLDREQVQIKNQDVILHVIGQLPRVSTEDRVVSVFEPSVCSLSACQQIGQLPRVSGEDPERIRVDSVVETFVCSLLECKQIFSFFVL